MTNSLLYPITLSYAKEWGAWEALREIYQNALDEAGTFLVEREDGNLIVSDEGQGLQFRHLLLGVSDKDDTKRGVHGEGLKLALLVLHRLGYSVQVFSGNLRLWPEEDELFGEKVLRISWEDGRPPVKGTRVLIEGYEGPDYQERIVRPGDPRILHQDQWGRMILEEDESSIYVKDIWTQLASGYSRSFRFSYNLARTRVDRSRNVVDTWSLFNEIGSIWAGVGSVDLWERLFQAIEDDQAEKFISLDSPGYGPAVKKAWDRVHGPHAVLKTDPDTARQALHRGATDVIDLGKTIAGALHGIVMTDTEHIQAMEGKRRVAVKDSDLQSEQRKNLSLLRRLWGKIGAPGKVCATIQEVPASWDGKAFRVTPAVLEDRKKTLETLLEEGAHALYGAKDDTPEMVQSIRKVAVDLLYPYVTR